MTTNCNLVQLIKYVIRVLLNTLPLLIYNCTDNFAAQYHHIIDILEQSIAVNNKSGSPSCNSAARFLQASSWPFTLLQEMDAHLSAISDECFLSLWYSSLDSRCIISFVESTELRPVALAELFSSLPLPPFVLLLVWIGFGNPPTTTPWCRWNFYQENPFQCMNLFLLLQNR